MTPQSTLIPAVSQRLNRFVQGQHSQAMELGSETELLLDAAAHAVEGGKRLRARFCATGWSAVVEGNGGPARELPSSLVDVAASLEIFHAAALVHDDIIDNSDTRRGRPAAHRALQETHGERGWVGDADQFGRSAAVLLGDLLLAWSDDLLEDGLDDVPVARAVRRQYAQMRRDVTIGQYLDVAEEAAHVTAPDDEHPERAIRIATFKSARYSVEQPLLIGASLAGASETQRDALSRFGLPVGLAFQLRDDVLGVFGDSVETGKPSGDDLREGKRTLLIAYTRQALPTGPRRAVDELLGDPSLDAGQIEALQNTIRSSGALNRVEADIARYAHEADRALSGAALGNTAVGELRDLARAAVTRTA